MSNPCPICGRLTDPQYAFCTNCGHLLTAKAAMPSAPVVPAAPAREPESIESIESPAPRTRRKKNIPGILISGGAVLVILCVALAVVLLYLNGFAKPDTPQAVLDRMIDAALDGEYEKMFDCVYEYHYSSELRQEAAEGLDEIPSDLLRSLGVDKETIKAYLKLRVKAQEEVGPQDNEAIRKTLTENGVTTEPIEEIVRAQVEISIMGMREDDDLFFVKADGRWFLLGSQSALTDPDRDLFE